jgi:hypothetical protein
MRIHYLENVSYCLKFMKDKGIKLVNISSEGTSLLQTTFLIKFTH